nr:MAG TPA: hypothetical protein [Caudoviricetes sp.]
MKFCRFRGGGVLLGMFFCVPSYSEIGECVVSFHSCMI